MRGKYSPTVSKAYQHNREWFVNYSKGEIYDPEGYDSYGYDKNDIDRAGNEEWQYYSDDYCCGNYKYDAAYNWWRFDGEKPVEYVEE